MRRPAGGGAPERGGGGSVRRTALHRARLLLPTLATGGIRVSQLVVLLAIVHSTVGDARATLVVGFGLIGVFTTLTDSGAGAFVLSGGRETRIRSVVIRAVRFHIATTAVGMVAACALTATGDGAAFAQVLPLLAALALMQLLDSTSRVVRLPLLAAGDDLAYALPDVALVLVKLSLLALALVTGAPVLLGTLFLPSLVQVVVSWVVTRRVLLPEGTAEPRLIARIAEFGFTGAASAFYSQVPLLVAAAFWSPAVVAPISVAYRVVQAFDLLPATASMQLIPRLQSGRVTIGRVWVAFVTLTVVLSVGLVVAKPLVDAVLNGVVPDPLLFATVALAFVPRSGNFALNAYAMSSGRIRVRLVATLITAAVSIVLAFAVVRAGGSALFGLTSFMAEAFFAVLLTALMVRRERLRPALVRTRAAR